MPRVGVELLAGQHLVDDDKLPEIVLPLVRQAGGNPAHGLGVYPAFVDELVDPVAGVRRPVGPFVERVAEDEPPSGVLAGMERVVPHIAWIPDSAQEDLDATA